MNSKLFVVFATLFAVLLIQQAACKEVKQVKEPDELRIVNPDSAVPLTVTDPNSPVSSMDQQSRIRFCIPWNCRAMCRSQGFKTGHCNNQAYCICTR